MENNKESNEEDYAEDTNMDEYLDDDYLVQLHNELKKAKIQAFQAIGVAYGKGQQPRVTIQKTRM